jgi:hypothetical protein
MSFLDRVFIEPQKLREIWGWVRPRLLEVQEHSDGNWIPEDVYTDCFNGRSMLWVVTDQGKPVGFGVMQPLGDCLHVWCGWGQMLMDEGFRHIREIAKAGGSRRISFDSNRPGWERVARKHGFRPKQWIAEV